MSITNLTTIANDCFCVAPDGAVHQVAEFGARPTTVLQIDPALANPFDPNTLG